MKNIKISTRLILAFGFLIILSIVIAAIGLWNIQTGKALNEEVSGRQEINMTMEKWARAVEVRTNQVYAYAMVSDPTMLELFKNGIESNTKHIDEYRSSIESVLTEPGSLSIFNDVLKLRKQYLETTTKLFEALDTQQYTVIDQIMNEDLPKVSTDYLKYIEVLNNYQLDRTQQAQAASAANDTSSTNIQLIASLLVLLLGLFSAWRVTKAITVPLRNAVNLAEKVANKDLSQDVQSKSNDEIGQLLNALAKMVNNLRSAIGEVRTGSGSIASAASQITAGNQDLAARTDEQSSSLAETAATMEEITSTVRQNADNSKQANHLAVAASKTASEGGAIVTELVGVMSEINTKSQQVAEIINVIDGIAFQTNILALNAAVEAARAGEQGRGFAVVASEVRALAQRSASAAREIKDLIDASVEVAGRGNEKADHAGNTMQEIVTDIGRVADIIGEINAASQEQTTAIEQINIAVTQMDDVTRQNASLVEQSAAAAGNLQQQADNLAELVSTFTLADGATASDSFAGGASAAASKPKSADIPSMPEKVIKPTYQAPRSSASTKPASSPALNAPSSSKSSAADTDEWIEF